MHTRPYEKLIAWKEAYNLCLQIYKVTVDFPGHEKFSLVNQLRRSAYSVPVNIAEGNMKKSFKDKCRFFEIAQASLEELHCELRLSKDLQYIGETVFQKLNDQVNRTSYLLTKLKKAFLNKSSVT